jgi:hypothetical protein
MQKTELRFTKHGIVEPVTEKYINEQGYVDPQGSHYVDRVWEEYHKIKDELAQETIHRKQLEDYIDEILKPRIHELEMQLDRYKKAVSELQKVTDAVKIWAEGSAYAKAGQLMGALHEYEANNGTH